MLAQLFDVVCPQHNHEGTTANIVVPQKFSMLVMFVMRAQKQLS
jgi:hypothetical protein